MKSRKELEMITNECYEKCSVLYGENDSIDFNKYVDSYLFENYPELNFTELNLILDTIEDIIHKESKNEYGRDD
jgi:hypothetical protein